MYLKLSCWVKNNSVLLLGWGYSTSYTAFTINALRAAKKYLLLHLWCLSTLKVCSKVLCKGSVEAFSLRQELQADDGRFHSCFRVSLVQFDNLLTVLSASCLKSTLSASDAKTLMLLLLLVVRWLWRSIWVWPFTSCKLVKWFWVLSSPENGLSPSSSLASSSTSDMSRSWYRTLDWAGWLDLPRSSSSSSASWSCCRLRGGSSISSSSSSSRSPSASSACRHEI